MPAGRVTVAAGATVSEGVDAMLKVLDAVRYGGATTRPEITRVSGLGRNVVAQRVAQLLDIGLLTDGAFAPSTGGRAARALHFRADAGYLLVAELGATGLGVAMADLAGRPTLLREEPADITDGPDRILGRVAELFTELRAERPDAEIWGIGLGLPGPVEFATGRPVAPPIMPGWDGFDVRRYFAERFNVPVWVDNEVNVMALGELRGGLAQGHRDVIYVKIGSGIGAGLISQGSLHRGAQGGAGDIGHTAVSEDSSVICRCGNIGCLEALAGGAALAREGQAAAENGSSPYLARLVANGGTVTAQGIAEAASHGDATAVQMLRRSAHLVGETLARMVNFFNPSLILIGGGVAEAGDRYLAEIRRSVFERSLPLATRALQIVRSPLGDQAGLRGAAFMVIDELLSADRFGAWIGAGSPAGRPELASRSEPRGA